jgi:ATP-dependent Clp protease, protease subunit
MPIGVPRIIYCWGEELPAQWTDIYNFIFRRRMVFLMQYLDDELCNQICGLLINIHMEDRSKELEKKEMERSGVFKSSSRASETQETKKKKVDLGSQGELNSMGKSLGETSTSFHKKQARSFEDLLNADEDLGIDDIDTLEQNTLQKITTEWLNWNAQFFDYSDEPYIFYLAELLSKDFNNNEAKNSLFSSLSRAEGKAYTEGACGAVIGQAKAAQDTRAGTSTRVAPKVLVSPSATQEGSSSSSLMVREGVAQAQQVQKISKLLHILKIGKKVGVNSGESIKSTFVYSASDAQGLETRAPKAQEKRDTARQEVAARLGKQQLIIQDNTSAASLLGNVYSPFRTYVTFELENYNLKNLISLSGFQKLLQKLEQGHVKKKAKGSGYADSASAHNRLNEAQGLSYARRDEKGCASPFAEGDVKEVQAKANPSTSPTKKKKVIYKFLSNIIQKNVTSKLLSLQQFSKYSAKALGQRHLRREYGLEHNLSILLTHGPAFSSAALSPKAKISDTKIDNKKGAVLDKPYALPRACNPSAYIKPEGLSAPQTFAGKETLKIDFAKSRHDILKSFSYLNSSSLAPKVHTATSLNDFADPYSKIQSLQRSSRDFPLGTVGSLSSEASASDKNSSNNRAITRDYYRKQTERALIDEESKKVFVIINSFGGSVGNGITIHDALQFIKAGSLTLGLGVAASAASLALAGGTIGERYVTEGCHVMIHQPEGGLQGQASDIWIDSQEIMKIRLDVAEIYSLATYRPRHKILRDLDRDFYLTAMETIYYGLADEIASNEIISEVINITNKAWDFQDSKQQRLLESRESASSGMDTQTQN